MISPYTTFDNSSVGERPSQCHVLALCRFDELVHRVPIVQDYQNDSDRDDSNRTGQRKITTKIEHRFAYLELEPNQTLAYRPVPIPTCP